MLQVREINASWNDESIMDTIGFCHMVVVVSGNGSVLLDGEAFEVFSGRVFFLCESVEFSLGLGSIQNGFVLVFDRFFFDSFLLHYPLARGFGALSSMVCVDVVAEHVALLIKELQRLKIEIRKRSSVARLKLLFDLAMLRVFDLQEIQLESSGDVRVERFASLLEQHFRGKRTASFYAGELGVTSRKLNSLCRGWFAGKGFAQVHRDRLLSEAEYLLLGTDKAIKEIAFGLQFCSQQHFRAYFFKFKGTSPSAFRSAGHEEGNVI